MEKGPGKKQKKRIAAAGLAAAAAIGAGAAYVSRTSAPDHAEEPKPAAHTEVVSIPDAQVREFRDNFQREIAKAVPDKRAEAETLDAGPSDYEAAESIIKDALQYFSKELPNYLSIEELFRRERIMLEQYGDRLSEEGWLKEFGMSKSDIYTSEAYGDTLRLYDSANKRYEDIVAEVYPNLSTGNCVVSFFRPSFQAARVEVEPYLLPKLIQEYVYIVKQMQSDPHWEMTPSSEADNRVRAFYEEKVRELFGRYGTGGEVNWYSY